MVSTNPHVSLLSRTLNTLNSESWPIDHAINSIQ